MQINCEGCGKCCYSENMSDFNMEKVAYYYEDPKRPKERENIVTLSKPEVKLFWENFMWLALEIKRIMIASDNEILPFIALKNFPKKIDGKWVSACSFLDPKTKRCRLYKTKLLPEDCKKYPYNIINNKMRSLCDNERLIGNLTEAQKKIGLGKTRFIRMKGISKDELIEKIEKSSNSRVLGELLHSYFGSPREPIGEEKKFLQGIFDEVNKELKFYYENFDQNKTNGI